MENIKKSSLRMLSKLGQRGTLGITIEELASENENIVALTSDLQNTSGLDRFSNKFPKRIFNVGISEQNMIGMAAGLASSGFIPFATSFANFTALRGNEFIRHFMGYMNENVKVVGMGAGFSMGMFGNTHYGLEDVAVLRSIPNLTILSPCDCLETKKAVISACQHDGPVYIRLSGTANNPIVYQENYEFEIGKAICLRNYDSDIAVVTTGSTVYFSLLAIDNLLEEDIKCSLWNVHTLSILDHDFIEQLCNYKTIFVVEDHRVKGGLNSLICETISSKLNKPIVHALGADFTFNKAGTYEYCMQINKIDTQGITNFIKNKIKGE